MFSVSLRPPCVEASGGWLQDLITPRGKVQSQALRRGPVGGEAGRHGLEKISRCASTLKLEHSGIVQMLLLELVSSP